MRQTEKIGVLCDINPSADTLADDDLVSFIPMARLEAESGTLDLSESSRFVDVRRKSYRPFRDGDVLFAKITPCMENGKIAVAKGLRNGHGFGSTEFHVLRTRGDVDPFYLRYFLVQPEFRFKAARHMTGTAGQLRVSAAFLRDESMPLPPLDEQRRIVQIIEQQFSRLDTGEAALRRDLTKISVLSASVFNQAAITSARAGTVALGDITDIISGPAFVSKHFGNPEDGVKLLRGENIEPGSLRWKNTKTWPESLLAGYEHLFVSEGDVILAMDRPLVSAGLKLAQVTASDVPALLVQRVARIRPRNDIDPFFIFLILKQPAFVRHVLEDQTGTQLPHITLNGIRSFLVPALTLHDQRQFVANVDRITSMIRGIRDNIARAGERSKQLRRVVLAAAFSGQMN